MNFKKIHFYQKKTDVLDDRMEKRQYTVVVKRVVKTWYIQGVKIRRAWSTADFLCFELL